MKGFDPEFTDLVDYIIRITARIWEGREIGAIRRFYADDCIVRTPAGITHGAEVVVASTLETLHAFPDRRLLAEDVIWSGDETVGFLSSHRIVSPMHHRGDGIYGPPTGRFVCVRTIADCAVKSNQVYEEWLVRDQAAIVRQVGLDPRTFATEAVAREVAAGKKPGAFTPEQDVAGAYRAPDSRIAPAERYGEMLSALWVDRDLCAVDSGYDEAATLHLPGGVTAHGKDGADRFWLGYLAALPDATFRIDHLIGRDDPGRAVRVAARWCARGTHAGHGAFGAPSGADVFVLGISHAEIVDGKVIREWVLVDEIAVWRQIAIVTG